MDIKVDPDEVDRMDQWIRYDDQHSRYKEELAEALVAFNRIESFVSDMIGSMLKNAKREDLLGRALSKQFMARVEALELLLISIPSAPVVPYARLKKLADKRNEFAHGHFTADANTGEMVVVGKGKATPWQPDSVIPFLEECSALRHELNRIFAYILFGEAPPASLFPSEGYSTSMEPDPSE